MRIWLITIGEPLPVLGNERLLRTGIFANYLSQMGHTVIWWTSTFDHVKKEHVVTTDRVRSLNDRLTLLLMKGYGYKRNISIARLYDHYLLGRKFKKESSNAKKPDIILCSFPSIELSVEAVKYGKKHAIPVVLDVRDLWPDIFVDVFPGFVQFIAKLLLFPMTYYTKFAFSNATAITGITNPFVEWGVNYAGRDRESMDQYFPMGYPKSSVTTINNEYGRDFWESKGIDKSRFLIVYFGYFGRQFDFNTVFQSALELQDQPVDFILCGAGDYFDYYREKAITLPNIFLPGWIGRSEIYTLMKLASVGLMPYVVRADFLNSIPNKFIEYLSAGLPILSTLDGVVGSLLEQEKCGIVYRSAADLTSAVKGLIGDEQNVVEMGKAAKKLFDAQFEASKVYNEMEKYLVEIIDNCGNGKK